MLLMANYGAMNSQSFSEKAQRVLGWLWEKGVQGESTDINLTWVAAAPHEGRCCFLMLHRSRYSTIFTEGNQ